MVSDNETPQTLRRRDRLVISAVALLILCLAWALWLVFQAQNISDLERAMATVTKPRDLNEVCKKSREGAYKVTVSEEELNAYLASKLEVTQQGVLSGIATLEKVMVRLEDERAEVVTVRNLFGRRFTTSIWLAIEQTENSSGEVQTSIEPSGGSMPILHRIQKGGRFGRLTIPQGFLLLTQSANSKLAAVFENEIQNGIQEMGRIIIRKGAIELDPNLDQTSSFLK